MKVVEFEGRGPGPFGAMILADPRRSIAIDLKRSSGVAVALRLIERADVLVEGFRPGVLERLGLGPQICLERNPGLAYARMTGWGRSGPLAQRPGHGMRAEGLWSDTPGANVLDLGAPFYNVYETLDGQYVTIGAGERQFYADLLTRLGLGDDLLHRQGDPATWAEDRATLAAVFRTKTGDEWCRLLEDGDTCFAPVLRPAEAPPLQPPVRAGRHTVTVLREYGFEQAEIDGLIGEGAVAQAALHAAADATDEGQWTRR